MIQKCAEFRRHEARKPESSLPAGATTGDFGFLYFSTMYPVRRGPTVAPARPLSPPAYEAPARLTAGAAGTGARPMAAQRRRPRADALVDALRGLARAMERGGRTLGAATISIMVLNFLPAGVKPLVAIRSHHSVIERRVRPS